eukprot:XP_024439597.1 1-aminocyclopropane-1-carboxylate oxidase homolog 3 [Populus trichocarpa]
MQSDLVQNGSVYDIEKELQDFDESKSGVKGLVDAGIIKTPPFFVVLESEVSCQPSPAHFHIPVIDLKGIHEDDVRRREIVEQMCKASETWGFFQVVNHGKSSKLEGRFRMVPDAPDSEEYPEVCRAPHNDPDFLTTLWQDHIGGLHVFHQDHWVDVPPIAGAFVVIIGDLLQISEHRVQANHIGPRISVASFFALYDWICAPLKELISDENPLYKEVPLKDYIVQYRWKERDGGISTLDRFRL